MKRLFTLFTGLCVMLLAGCNDEYDDSALVKRDWTISSSGSNDSNGSATT